MLQKRSGSQKNKVVLFYCQYSDGNRLAKSYCGTCRTWHDAIQI